MEKELCIRLVAIQKTNKSGYLEISNDSLILGYQLLGYHVWPHVMILDNRYSLSSEKHPGRQWAAASFSNYV